MTRLKKLVQSDSLNRRRFFRSFLGETISMFDEIRGRPQLQLAELDQLPDPVIRAMKPIKEDSGPYTIENNELVFRKVDSAPKIIYSFEAWEREIISRFDGTADLDEIARQYASSQGLDPESAYLQVKSLFSVLATYMVFRPSEFHDTAVGSGS